VRSKVYERQRRGEEIWWYQASWPKPPFPTLFIDSDGIEPRIIFWQKWLNHVSGLLYWGGARWGEVDPWNDAATRKARWPNLYGDGYLVYPGKPAGVDGPVSSIRLENIRDGIEDHAYLTAYAAFFGREEADEMARRIVKSLTNFTHEPEALEEVRLALAIRLNQVWPD
jgi:hypothetical protein